MELYSYYSTTGLSDTSCKFAGFSVTFLSLVSISHLVAISVERRYIMKHPIKARILSKQLTIALYIVVFSWSYGLLWAVFPVLGWSRYMREEQAIHRCNIDLSTHSRNSLSYSCRYMLLFIKMKLFDGITCMIRVIRKKIFLIYC